MTQGDMTTRMENALQTYEPFNNKQKMQVYGTKQQELI